MSGGVGEKWLKYIQCVAGPSTENGAEKGDRLTGCTVRCSRVSGPWHSKSYSQVVLADEVCPVTMSIKDLYWKFECKVRTTWGKKEKVRV